MTAFNDTPPDERALAVAHEIRKCLTAKAPHQVQAIEQLKDTDIIWGNVDSLLIVVLVSHLEKTFGFKTLPREFTPENLATIQNIVGFVLRSTQKK